MKFVTIKAPFNHSFAMKDAVHRNWEGLNTDKKSQKISLDQATLLGGLTIVIFAYIIFRFIYPLIDKGVLW